MYICDAIKNAVDTRSKILRTSLELFHRGSFAGTSLNQIVAVAGITKGALFHYFKGKNELGYAVVDEALRKTIHEHWIKPLENSDDPIHDIQKILELFAQEMERSPEMLECGCPLNNLAQEMSAIDQSFRLRMSRIYEEWEEAIELSFKAGIEAGNVRGDIDPAGSAKVMVAMLEGSIGMMKVHQSREHAEKIWIGFMQYLTSLK